MPGLCDVSGDLAGVLVLFASDRSVICVRATFRLGRAGLAGQLQGAAFGSALSGWPPVRVSPSSCRTERDGAGCQTVRQIDLSPAIRDPVGHDPQSRSRKTAHPALPALAPSSRSTSLNVGSESARQAPIKQEFFNGIGSNRTLNERIANASFVQLSVPFRLGQSAFFRLVLLGAGCNPRLSTRVFSVQPR